MRAWQTFDNIGRMDERAHYPTPGSDRVRDGRQMMAQEDPSPTRPTLAALGRLFLEDVERFIRRTEPYLAPWHSALHWHSALQRAGDEVI